MIPPLAIIQARMGSSRLPGKMMLPIGGDTLVGRVWKLTCQAFGKEHTVVAYPATRENDPMATELDRLGAELFPWYGKENDVLSRFHACAHTYRWHPDSVILRVTADDWCKMPSAMLRVANGERLPAEIGGEAFTLAMLDEAHQYSDEREHLTHALFEIGPPSAPDGIWSIDTQADYQAVLSALDAT